MEKRLVLLQARLSLILSLLLLGCSADDLQQSLNQNPVIVQMVPPTVVVAGQRLALQVEASDPDGDALTFTWEVSGGTITGNDTSDTNDTEVVWLAPTEPGRYIITVTVDDGKGGTIQKSVEVIVTTPELGIGDVPVQSEVPVQPEVPVQTGVVQPPDPPNLAAPFIQSFWAVPGVLTADQTALVTVEATDPTFGEMQYTWRATGGQLLPVPPEPGEAEGARMQWEPPEKPGTYTLTISVVNQLAEQSEASIPVRVFPVVSGNHTPTIQSFQAQPGTLVRGGRDTARFTVRAFDPDGDKLSYFWNLPRGTVKGKGPQIQWTPPAPLAPCCAIPYTVTVAVTVSDGKGGSDAASIQMTVVP